MEEKMKHLYSINFKTYAASPDEAKDKFKKMIAEKYGDLAKYGQARDWVPEVVDTGEFIPDTLREWLTDMLVDGGYVTVTVKIKGNDAFSTDVSRRDDIDFVSPTLLRYYVDSYKKNSYRSGVPTSYVVIVKPEAFD